MYFVLSDDFSNYLHFHKNEIANKNLQSIGLIKETNVKYFQMPLG